MTVSLDTAVQYVKGVGEARAALLRESGLETARDLLFYFPFRYEDRRHPVRIAELGHKVGTPVLLRGRIVNASARVTPRQRMKLFEAVLDDGTGAVKLVWFNQPYLEKQIARGDRLSLFGTPRVSGFALLGIENPEWEKFEGAEDEEGAVVPIYSRLGNIPQKAIRRIVAHAMEALPQLEDPLPAALREKLGLIGLQDALHAVHAPTDLTPEFLAQRSPAHVRLILQEFFTLQLALRVRRASEEVRTKSRRIVVDDALREEVRRVLPFKLTAAQKRVVREIAADLASDRPMYRLLQGDVGSGKTIVALIAALVMIRSGYQVALLAPTEILVEQHYQRISQLVDRSVRVVRATGSMTAGERRTLRAALREGLVDLAVGTHALLEEDVQFKSLALAIVDEQHRFGVEQRQRLFAKGETPDILVMTATPIPRSLALAIYGDLELSVIDELPPGRQKIKTVLRSTAEADRVFHFIEDQVAEGAQAYVVFPIIEESEKLNLKPLNQGYEQIRARFPKLRVAMMHGRMKAAEKEETMQRFKGGEIDVLVSTTVIEVGIDVPNASIMLIVDADRFGLSQLHQLRGRVGRGARKSYCVLLCDERTGPDARARLEAFERTRDGFEVAEQDLQTRGPGEFIGTRQSGALRFRLGNILRDHDLMERARDEAIAAIDAGLPQAEELARALLGARAGMATSRD